MDYNSEDSYDELLLEPVILINDGEDDDGSLNAPNNEDNTDLIRACHPDVSIIPIKRKKPLFKIKLFDKKKPVIEKKRVSSYSDEDISSAKRGPRSNVRIVTKEEVEKTPELYRKCESLSLEKCPVCNKYFKRMATHLLKHELVDSKVENTGLNCRFCSKSFTTQSNLLIHLRTHTGSRPYICEICSKAFSQSCNLLNHMRIHSGERPFKCPYCDKAFTQKGNLNNHIRLHTNEKPFKCHFCDKAFVQSGNLNSHIKNNHLKGSRGYTRNMEACLSESSLNNTI